MKRNIYNVLFILLVIEIWLDKFYLVKFANKLKGVHEVAVAQAVTKGILVSCKREGSSGFAKAEVQVERESR